MSHDTITNPFTFHVSAFRSDLLVKYNYTQRDRTGERDERRERARSDWNKGTKYVVACSPRVPLNSTSPLVNTTVPFISKPSPSNAVPKFPSSPNPIYCELCITDNR